jgi:FKBP-type peptidyl-prolyl cis-trans isomerase FklB
MKRLVVVVAAAALVSGGVVMAQEKKPDLTDQKHKVSYALGMSIGLNMKRQGIEVDPATLARGLADAYAGGETLLTDKEAQETLMAFQHEMQAKQQEKAKSEAADNEKKGQAFLEENKKKDGVKTLPDGLQYKVLKEGTGKQPTAESTVKVNYKGTLIDGTEFDSSYKRGQPAEFAVNGVIKGWTEALQLMKEGAKWQLYVPASLAYGDRGAGNVIPPGSTLIFDVELLQVK